MLCKPGLIDLEVQKFNLKTHPLYRWKILISIISMQGCYGPLLWEMVRIGPIKDFSALLVQDVLLSTATIPDDTRLYYTGNQKERQVFLSNIAELLQWFYDVFSETIMDWNMQRQWLIAKKKNMMICQQNIFWMSRSIQTWQLLSWPL